MTESKHLGDALVKEALAPLRHASTLLSGSALDEALEALAKADLEAALRRGVEAAAKLFDVKSQDIEREINVALFSAALEKLENARLSALDASKRQASSMSVQIADPDSVGDGKRRTCAEALVHHARKFVKDKPLAAALETLGAEISAYQALVSQSGDKLDASPLHGRNERRKLVVIAALCGIVFVAIGLVVSAWWSKKKVADARARIEAAIANTDPCAVESISSEDEIHATAEQKTRERAELVLCAEVRAKEKYIASCDALATHFALTKLSPEDEALAKDTAPRLVRATKHELTVDDLLATPKDMPCQDAPSKDRFFATYAKHAAASSKAWATVTRVSDSLTAALSAKDFAGETTYLVELDKRAEPLAGKAILSGKPEDLAQAGELCTFRASFSRKNGGETGGKCAGLLVLLAKKKR